MKRWQIALAVIVAGIAAAVLAVVGVGFYLSPQDGLRSADMIVAVSGGETQQRAAEAIKLYQEGYAPKLLFSGAAQDKTGPSNAEVMRLQALKAGISSNAIIVEENSKNTTENALASAAIIKSNNARSIILVTSPYHQRRASLNFKQVLGKDVLVLNHSSVDSAWRKNSWWSDPYTLGLTISELQKSLYVISTKPEKEAN